MAKKDPGPALGPPKSTRSLRERAEVNLKKGEPDLSRMSQQQIQQLVYELQVHQIELQMQNEELLRVQAELAQSRDRFTDLYDFAPVGFLTLGDDSTILEANLRITTMLGLDRRNLLGQKLSRFVLPESQDALYLHQQKVLHSEESQRCELSLRRVDGTSLFVQMESLRLKDGAAPFFRASACAVTDITERKHSEALSRAYLEEKELLLREIHHRVKNNLQIISSLISLQADSISDPVALGLLGDVRDRVRSMALVHERLYQSENLASVDFAEYVRGLLEYLMRAHGDLGNTVRLTLKVQPLELPVGPAVQCGLILNELFSNALKHAFPDRSKGEVTVELSRDVGMSQACLRVRDNGVGLPVGFSWKESPSLGLRLVQMLAQQLRATVEIGDGKGAEFRVKFTVGSAKMRS